MSIFMILFWVVLAGAAVFVVSRLRKFNEHNAKHSTSQIDFIKSQYDKGEISKEQYKQLIRDMTK